MENLIERAELQDSVHRFLDKHGDRRGLVSGRWGDSESAAFMASIAELGWLALTVPPELDGLGQPFLALQPLYYELGRSLAAVPLAGSMAAIDVLAPLVHHRPCADLLTRIAAGTASVATVVTDGGGLRREGSCLSGSVGLVQGAGQASALLLIVEGTAPLITLIALPTPGVTCVAAPTWDKTRILDDVCLTDVDLGGALALVDGAPAVVAAGVGRAHLDLALACDSLGGADILFEETLAYMATRQQFGRAIASFQALKHRSADLKVALEAARALLDQACDAFSARRDGWAAHAAQAKFLLCDTFRAVAIEAIQFHGGIGFTWEHDCHLFFKRAWLNAMLGGTQPETLDRIAAALFGAATVA